MVTFIISRTRQKKFYFTVESSEEATLLVSEFYSSKIACKKGITSLKNAVQGIARYQWNEEQDNSVSFIIKSINGRKLATSELYNNLQASTEGLMMLKAEIPAAIVIDQTTNFKNQKNTVKGSNNPIVTMISFI
jgi:uncharacterized protein YegP (UPF0339 family)